MKRWLAVWWSRNHIDIYIFGGLLELTGVALAVPAIILYQAITIPFRAPAYLINLVDFSLGLAPEMRLVTDARKVAGDAKALAATLRGMIVLLWRGA